MEQDSDSTNADLGHARQHRAALRALILGRPPAGDDARELAQVACERAALALTSADLSPSGAHDALDEAGAALAEGAAAGAAAVLSHVLADLVEEADLELCWNDDTRRRMPPGGRTPGPSDWLRALSCALLVRDRNALEVLCAPAHVAAVQLPTLADAFWPPLCEAIAGFVRDGTLDTARLSQAEAALMPERIKQADADTIAAEIAPLPALLRACAAQRHWTEVFDAAMRAYRSPTRSVDRTHDPYLRVSLEFLGMAALAADRRLAVAAAGAATALVRGEQRVQPIAVTLRYRLRHAQRAEDAIGFLDLRGCARVGREHDVVLRDVGAVARYRVRGPAGVPRVAAEFLLDASAATAPPAPALDAGERLLLAQAYAEAAASDDRAAAQAWLQQAILMLDGVLASITPPQTRPADAAFVNARGLAFYAAEPGRFERDRLQAYRQALNTRLQTMDAESATARDPRSVAFHAIAQIRTQLTPLLQALANDRSGAVLQQLRPRDDDYAKVFVPQALAEARAAYTALWAALPDFRAPAATQRELQIDLAPAGMFTHDNELSREFPSGYMAIAAWLVPSRTWASWTYRQAGEPAGLRYDGLVWCDDHWAWFPKPYRALRALASS